ncbi:OmpP1/FadL family transporter [Bdellovibrio sp. HCB337]|uniref:OmpP1/FadL family transporter n=1 Tax=Bdellovibrio sp. HCB337 TaxID=3394358 RepID=UPI0039A769A2
MSLKYYISLSILLVVQTSMAAFSNYNSILIGDQAAGMGGAYTAMTSDVSALAYYNPAGLAFLDGHSFSAAVGIYKKFDTSFGEEEDYTKAPLRINQGFFRAIPSSTGNVFKKGDYTLAFSIVVPDFDSFKGDLRNNNENITTLSYIDESLWVGGAAAKKISDTESMGLTVYYTARSYTRSLNDRSFPTASEAILFNSEKILVENALVAILGYHLDMSEKWSFGASLRTPSLPVKGTGSYFSSRVETNPYSVTTVNRPDEKSNVNIPAKFALGVAYREGDDVRVSADASFYQSLEYKDFNDPAIGTHWKHSSIWNLALGLEKRILSWMKIRTGVFTNFSSHPNPDSSLAGSQPDKVDQVGFSANLVFNSGDKIDYTFGGYYTGGRGKSMQQINQTTEEVIVTQHVFTMLVGTAFSF